jgi:Cu(I)/Ag(I) efflux system membrane protein CusA/SilA
MIGGVFTSFLLELIVYPILFELWKWHTEVKKTAQPSIDESIQKTGHPVV